MDLTYEAKVGQGAFADVWRATDTLGRSVAVKFFNDSSPTQAELNAIVHARALVRVDCASVVRVHAVERQQHPESGASCLAIVMEYIPGPTLAHHVERLSAEHAVSVIRDLAGAIEAIHSAGIVHGDLHDRNVVVTQSGAKVVDILYTRSLADVGRRTAARDRAEDLRDLAGLLRQIVVKTGQNGPALAETYYSATRELRSASEIGELFLSLLPLVGPIVSATASSPGTSVENMSVADFSALLGSVDDSADSHILWVTKSGHARLSPVGPRTPVGFQAAHSGEMQFRWETFGRGNHYCGEHAAEDLEYAARKLAELKGHWQQRRVGYVDY